MARMGETRGTYRRLVGNPEEQRSLGRQRRRCEDNKRYIEEIGLGGGLNCSGSG